MRRTAFRLSAAFAILAAASSAAALEMVSNGRFDTGTAGWSVFSAGDLSFDGRRDAEGQSGSGSAELVNSEPDAFVQAAIGRCLGSVSPAKEYFFGAKVRFREGEVAQGTSSLLVFFHPESSCGGTALDATGGETLVSTSEDGRGIWLSRRIGTPKSGVKPPAGAKSARLRVLLIKTTAGGALSLNVDSVFGAPTGTPLCDGFPASIVGTPRDDLILNATDAGDVIVGRAGNDVIDGKGGNDRICGGRGNDTIGGGSGDDRIFGGSGTDTLLGGPGSDLLRGQGGDDELYGQGHDDKLRGGRGHDTCDGGTGTDIASSCETSTQIP